MPGGLVTDQMRRFQQRCTDRCGLDLQNAQHARDIAPEPAPSASDIGNWIGGHGAGQFAGHGNQAFQFRPLDHWLKRLIVTMCHQKRHAHILERQERVSDAGLGIINPGIGQAFGFAPSASHNPVMGFNKSVRDSSLPFQGTHAHDGITAVIGEVAQCIRKVSFAVAAQAFDLVQWNVGHEIGWQLKLLQAFQPIQKLIGSA